MTSLLERMSELNVLQPLLSNKITGLSHVPFDSLNGNNDVEGALLGCVQTSKSVGLVGVSGAGKSSVARYVLDGPNGAPDRVAPIFVSLLSEKTDLLANPTSFVQHVGTLIIDAAAAVKKMDKKQRAALLAGAVDQNYLPDTARKNSAGVWVSGWILRGNIAADVTKTAKGGAIARPGQKIFEHVDAILQSILGEQLEPVLVLDDADRMLRRDPDTLIPAFFGDVLRQTVDELDVGVVVSLQPEYLKREDYKTHATGLIQERIVVPELAGPDAVSAILTARIQYAKSNRTAADAFDDDAIVALFNAYQQMTKKSIRTMLTIASLALTRAIRSGHQQITALDVEESAEDLLQG